MGILFTDNLFQTDTGYGSASARVRMTPLFNFSGAAAQFRVRCIGHSALSSIVSKLTVGYGTAANALVPILTPTVVTFGGNLFTPDLAGGAPVTSDWMNLAGSGIAGMTTNHELLVTAYFNASGGNTGVRITGGLAIATFQKAGDQTLSFVGTGWTFNYNGTVLVDLIETQGETGGGGGSGSGSLIKGRLVR